MDQKIFWATKSPLIQFETLEINHSSFAAPIRLVANQFSEVTAAGVVFTPCPMGVQPPQQSSDPVITMTINFPRIVIGREFIKRLNNISAAGTLAEITIRYRKFTSDDMANPTDDYTLYAKDLGYNGDFVSIGASDNNPMNKSIGVITTVELFPGLEVL